MSAPKRTPRERLVAEAAVRRAALLLALCAAGGA